MCSKCNVYSAHFTGSKSCVTISGCAARQPNEGGFDVMVKCPHISVCRIAIAVGRVRSDGVVVASQANITIGVGKLQSPIRRDNENKRGPPT